MLLRSEVFVQRECNYVERTATVILYPCERSQDCSCQNLGAPVGPMGQFSVLLSRDSKPYLITYQDKFSPFQKDCSAATNWTLSLHEEPKLVNPFHSGVSTTRSYPKKSSASISQLICLDMNDDKQYKNSGVRMNCMASL